MPRRPTGLVGGSNVYQGVTPKPNFGEGETKVNIKTTLKTSVAAAALFAFAAPVATPANAADDTLKSGNKNSLTISGYVAKGAWYADDGDNEALFLTDGSTSRTRVRWIAKGKLNESTSAGAMIEMDIPLSNAQQNMSLGGVGITNDDATQGSTTTNTAWGVRHQFVWVKNKKFGKLSLGNTNPAGNGNAEAILTGTNSIDLSSAKPFGQGLRFVETSGGASALSRSSVTVGGAFTNFDGLSRTDTIRYDLPKFKGLALAASYQTDSIELGARYSGKAGGVKFIARVVYDALSGASTSREYHIGASAAALHDSGVNAAVSWGKGDLLNPAAGVSDPDFIFFALGWRGKVWDVGRTNVAVTWNQTNDIVNNDEAESVGVTAVQNFDAIGANIGVFYRNYSLDRPGSTFDDIDIVGMQTIFNF